MGVASKSIFLKTIKFECILFYRGTAPEEEDIKDDLEEDERKLHSNVLLTIGAIARKAPAHCCHVLFTLLQDRSKR